MEHLTQNTAPTFESVWASLQENARQLKENERILSEKFAETDRMIKESSEKADKVWQQVDKERQESAKARQESAKARQESAKARQIAVKEQAEFRKSMNAMRKESAIEQADFRKSMNAMRKESAIEQADFRKSMKAMQKELGGVSNSNGEVAESYFINSFSKSMSFAGEEYDAMDSNLRRKIKKHNLQGEYDLVLYNCKSIVIIEIKYKAKKENVEELLQKAPIFKQLFPQYAHYDIYLGLAALHIDVKTEKESIKQGIAVIKQVGKTMVINDANLKVF